MMALPVSELSAQTYWHHKKNLTLSTCKPDLAVVTSNSLCCSLDMCNKLYVISFAGRQCHGRQRKRSNENSRGDAKLDIQVGECNNGGDA